MKNYILLVLLTSFSSALAQTNEETKLPIDSAINCEIRYYYFPNMEAYYDMKNEEYRYQYNKVWVTSEELPANYGGYSLFKNERVMLTDFEGDNPESLIKQHRKMYPYNPKGRIKRPMQPQLTENSTASLD